MRREYTGVLRAGRLAVAALLLAFASGCAAEGETSSDGAELAIYVSVPLSGPQADAGRDVAAGVALAFGDEAPRRAGEPAEELATEAGGAKVTARFLDAGQGDAEFAQAVAGANARTAAEDSATIAYVGELDTNLQETSLAITREAEILQVVPPRVAQEVSGEVAAQLEAASLDPSSRYAAFGFEAATAILRAIGDADDPTSRESVRSAYVSPF